MYVFVCPGMLEEENYLIKFSNIQKRGFIDSSDILTALKEKNYLKGRPE